MRPKTLIKTDGLLFAIVSTCCTLLISFLPNLNKVLACSPPRFNVASSKNPEIQTSPVPAPGTTTYNAPQVALACTHRDSKSQPRFKRDPFAKTCSLIFQKKSRMHSRCFRRLMFWTHGEYRRR
jgi:hypothetical protein